MTPLCGAEGGGAVVVHTGNGHRVDVERVVNAHFLYLERSSVLGNLHFPVIVVVPYVHQDYVVAVALDVVVVLGIIAVRRKVLGYGSLDRVHVVGTELIVRALEGGLIVVSGLGAVHGPDGISAGSAVLGDVDAGSNVSRPPPAGADRSAVNLRKG